MTDLHIRTKRLSRRASGRVDGGLLILIMLPVCDMQFLICLAFQQRRFFVSEGGVCVALGAI